MTESVPSRQPSRFGAASTDAALLVLRLGLGFSYLFLVLKHRAEAAEVLSGHAGAAWPAILLSVPAFCVAVGFLTEVAAVLSAAAWNWALLSSLQSAQPWVVFPVRDAIYVILFAALAVTGPGKYSIRGSMVALRREGQLSPSQCLANPKPSRR